MYSSMFGSAFSSIVMNNLVSNFLLFSCLLHPFQFKSFFFQIVSSQTKVLFIWFFYQFFFTAQLMMPKCAHQQSYTLELTRAILCFEARRDSFSLTKYSTCLFCYFVIFFSLSHGFSCYTCHKILFSIATSIVQLLEIYTFQKML